MISFIESKIAPNPKMYTYWVDIQTDPTCGIIKHFDGKNWVVVSGGSEDVEELKKQLATKVDKVSGKQLSTNDYTTAEKQKLAGIATQANKTVVENVLTSTSATNALSAAQGKKLNDLITALTARVSALEAPAA